MRGCPARFKTVFLLLSVAVFSLGGLAIGGGSAGAGIMTHPSASFGSAGLPASGSSSFSVGSIGPFGGTPGGRTTLHPDYILGCPPHCILKVNAIGLPTDPSVGIAFPGYQNSTIVYSTNLSRSFNVSSNTTYSFVIVGPHGYAVSSGSALQQVAVGTANVTVNVQFYRAATTDLTIRESGLFRGTEWCWTFAGVANICSDRSSSRIGNLTQGSYAVAPDPVPGYNLTAPPPTPVILTGAAVTEHVQYAPVRYGVTFLEHGLAPGDRWTVRVASIPGSAPKIRETGTSTGDEIHILLANGTYGYSVKGPHGFIFGCPPHCIPPVSDQFSVSGSSVGVNVTFALATTNVTFEETGLSGQTWGISLNGSAFGWSNRTLETNGTSVTFAGVPNGTYLAYPVSVAGFVTAHAIHLSVHGPRGPITVHYSTAPSAGSRQPVPANGLAAVVRSGPRE